jgi:outer membrane protein
MKPAFLRFLTCAISVLSITALAQSSSPSAGLPAAPSAAGSSAADPAPVATNATGTKVGTINIQEAIFASNEGQRDFAELSKKFEPKQTELKAANDEIESLKKQLNTQGEKLNDASRGTLVKQIETKQKQFDRSRQDAMDDAQNQQNEIAQKILQKMAPIIVKYAGDNAFGVIIDTSNPWPNGPVLWAGPSVDITRPIVDAYNVQSGVPAPPKPAAGAKPTIPGTKPLTAPSTTTPKPQGTQPPK